VEFVNTTRRGRFCSSIIFVVLAICVFSWGLGYKLSLYQTHQPNDHFIIQAKLLSKNERTVAQKRDLVGGLLPPAPASVALPWCVALAFAALVLKPALFTLSKIEPTVSWHCRRLTSLTSFFFRPPPILS
jgi:hypothetical protein